MQPGVLQHLDAAVLRGGQDRAGAAVRICSQLGFPDAPALLAQAAASLDLLSSGRFELGIGPTDTNAWDAIEAMGGVRRTPAESVRALSEAIDIIRGIWDVSAPGMMRIEGKHYRVSDTMRGPPPAHNISIWMPAARRHIRQLVGRKADGWISGRVWMTDVEGELALGNRIIDEAATEAGRDPRDVTRIFDYHGSFGQARRGFLQDPPEQWVEVLLPLVIEHGVSTFILVGDDPRAIQRFGGEVTPALRKAVARERQAAGMRTKETKTKVARKGGKSYLL